MQEHSCSEEQAKETLKQRIRLEVAKYIQVVKDTHKRTDLSDEVKRYIDTMQYTLSGNAAWSTQCPRYNSKARWNELQVLRAEHGVAKYPAMWPPKDSINGVSSMSNSIHLGTGVSNGLGNGLSNNLSNGLSSDINGLHKTAKASAHKRKRTGDDPEAGPRVYRGSAHNGIDGAQSLHKLARCSQLFTDSLDLEDVVSLALESELPDLSDDVSLARISHSFCLILRFRRAS